MCPEPGAANVSDGDEEQDILRRAFVDLGVVVDVDGDEDTTAEEGNSCEHPAQHSEEPEECDGVWPDLVQKLRFLGVYEWGEPTEERV
jgi:hypothetical protein